MGTWDTGPFDNDTAADWCGGVDDASPEERQGLVRDTVTRATDTVYGPDGTPWRVAVSRLRNALAPPPPGEQLSLV